MTPMYGSQFACRAKRDENTCKCAFTTRYARAAVHQPKNKRLYATKKTPPPASFRRKERALTSASVTLVVQRSADCTEYTINSNLPDNPCQQTLTALLGLVPLLCNYRVYNLVSLWRNYFMLSLESLRTPDTQ